MIRALLVDLGKVLVGFDHGITCARLAEAAGVPADRLRPVLFGELEAAFDRGRLSPAEFFRSCEADAGIGRLPDDVWERAWRDIFHPLPEAVDMLRRVRPGVRKVLVSNTNALHWQGVLGVFSPAGLVDATVLSFRIGAVKPEDAFWRAALDAAGCSREECLYADDRPELVRAAASAGIPGFVVDSPDAFAAGLAARGLLATPSVPSGNFPVPADVRPS